MSNYLSNNMINKILSILIIIITSQSSLGLDFCNYPCKNEAIVNSGCECDTVKKGCKVMEGNSSRTFEIKMLVTHNLLRERISMNPFHKHGLKSAANMMLLSYDQDLAFIARCHALRHCANVHDLCRDTDRFNEGLMNSPGQNIFASNTKHCMSDEDGSMVTPGIKCQDFENPDHQFWHKAIHSWFAQMKRHNFANLTDYYEVTNDLDTTKEFTQLIWAETTHVGCASVEDTTVCSGCKGDRYFLVCNYGPGGNIPGEPIYKTGDKCSKCPDGVNCNHILWLCGNQAAENVTVSPKKQVHTPSNFMEYLNNLIHKRSSSAISYRTTSPSLPLMISIVMLFYTIL